MNKAINFSNESVVRKNSEVKKNIFLIRFASKMDEKVKLN